MPEFTGQFSTDILKELCVVAQLDIWSDEDITGRSPHLVQLIKPLNPVFGNSGLHLILKGSVVPQAEPFYKAIGEKVEFRSPTPPPLMPLPAVRNPASSWLCKQ